MIYNNRKNKRVLMINYGGSQIFSFNSKSEILENDPYSSHNGIVWDKVYYYDRYYTGHRGAEQEGKLLWLATDLEANTDSNPQQSFHFSLKNLPRSPRDEVMLNIRLLSDVNSVYRIWNESGILKLTINGHVFDLHVSTIRGIHNIQAVFPANWLNAHGENSLKVMLPHSNIVTNLIDRVELRDCEQLERYNPPDGDW
jgi:hypothetical protein